jgi:copper chaperone CopZ
MKKFYEKHKHAIHIGGAIVGMLLVCVVAIYLTSSSETSTPKADEFGKQSANSHAESVTLESEANTIAEQVGKVDQQRVAEGKNVESSKSGLKGRTEKLNKSRSEYEKVRNTPVTVDTNDLDDRERRLFAELKRLYWSQ